MASHRPSSIPSPTKFDRQITPLGRNITQPAGTSGGANRIPAPASRTDATSIQQPNRSLHRQPSHSTAVPSKLAAPSSSSAIGTRQTSRIAAPGSSRVQNAPRDVQTTGRQRPMSMYAPKPIATLQQATAAKEELSKPVVASKMPPPSNGRPALTHSRSRSVTTMPAVGAAKVQQSAASTRLPPPNKPDFNMYQQHYSPRKPAALTPIQIDSGTEVNNSVVRLQDELLQMTMLANAGQRKVSKMESEMSKRLKKQERAIQQSFDDIRDEKLEVSRILNRRDLAEWLKSVEADGLTLTEKVQTLSDCIRAVGSISTPGGKLIRAIDAFETWLEDAYEILRQPQSAQERGFFFVEPLPAEWHDTVASSTRRLLECKKGFELLGSAESSSGIGRVLGAHKAQVSILLEELRCAEELESMVVKEQHDRCQIDIADLLSESVDAIGTRPAAWEASIGIC